MKRFSAALMAFAFVSATTMGARAQQDEVIAYVNFTWHNYSQAECLDLGETAVNEAILEFGITDATTRVTEWSVLGRTSDVNFWVFCVVDDDDLVDAAANRVLAVTSVNSGRPDIDGALRDFLAECMFGACPTTAAGNTLDWDDHALDYRGQNGALLDFVCPALGNATMGTIWGTDVYTDDSPICVAAVHAGVIGTNGGNVTIEILPGQKSYRGSTRNGVTSNEWGAYDGAYRIVIGG